MKQDVLVSNGLSVRVVKASAAQSGEKAQCEVVGVGCAQSGKSSSAKSAKKSAPFVLHRDCQNYQSLVSRLVEAEEFSAKGTGQCLVRFSGGRGGEHVLFCGTGLDKEDVNALGPVERLRRLGGSVAKKLLAEKIDSAVVHLESFLLPAVKLSIDPEVAAYAFVEGMGLATYTFEKYFTKKEKEEPGLEITLVSTQTGRLKSFEKGVEHAQAMVFGAKICRDFGNEPANELTPAIYGKQVQELAQKHGVKCKILNEKELEKEKMGLLLGVGQGSANPPRLFVLEYAPKSLKKGTKTIAFVGKGITFDTGGISIKPSANMEDMKHDMCGSAAVVGAIFACAKLKLPVRVIAIVAAAENMPSGTAIVPGNIIRSRSGKTVEVNNTDAEGRLVLADALDYVQDMKPDYIIDLATLTGAATVTLGKAACGLMGNDAAFSKLAHAAAREAGERVWELPLFDEYFEELKSDYADMRNHGNSPAAGTARGAMFLKQFIRKDTRWIHLDIASVAYNVPGIPYYVRRGSTGYGVRLLVELAKKI